MSQPKMQMVITLMDNGSVQVQGPLANKMLCYGILEMARDAIKDYKPPIITPVVGMNDKDLKNGAVHS